MEDPRQIYHGNCHCGGYRFQISLALNEKLEPVACDCRLCKKQGYIWYAPLDLNVTRDDGNIVEYVSTTVEHEFCGVCGTGLLGRHSEGPLRGRTVINARTLRGINPFEIEHRRQISDASATPAALPRVASCDCGQVKAELLHVPDEAEIKEDNCSICTRNAWVGIYPRLPEVKVTGSEHMTDYRFGRRFMGHPFCKTCGVHVVMNVHGPPQQVIDRLPEERKAMVAKNLDLKPVNVRALDGVDLSRLKIERSDEGTEGYEWDVLGESERAVGLKGL